jgi:hypothetical protein
MKALIIAGHRAGCIKRVSTRDVERLGHKYR